MSIDEGMAAPRRSGREASHLQVAHTPDCRAVGVRDTTQNGQGPTLMFSAKCWLQFIRAAKKGEFDLV